MDKKKKTHFKEMATAIPLVRDVIAAHHHIDLSNLSLADVRRLERHVDVARKDDYPPLVHLSNDVFDAAKMFVILNCGKAITDNLKVSRLSLLFKPYKNYGFISVFHNISRWFDLWYKHRKLLVICEQLYRSNHPKYKYYKRYKTRLFWLKARLPPWYDGM